MTIPDCNADDTVNLVVEIPTGTNEKWEVVRDGSRMEWELKNGKPRVATYLGYPGNYGMVPRTKAGDGDSLDILALGPSLPRGTVLPVKLIGVLKYREDDKLIALMPASPLFEGVGSLADLDARFPGISRILETWFSNCKGPGTMFFQGFGDLPESKKVLADAMGAFRDARHAGLSASAPTSSGLRRDHAEAVAKAGGPRPRSIFPALTGGASRFRE